MSGLERIVIESQIRHRARAEVLQNNVCGLNELQCHVAALWIFQIEGNRSLVSVVHWKVPGARAFQAPRIVAF